MTWLRQQLTVILIFATLLVCNVYFFPRWADVNQNSRLDMVVAVVDDGTFQIDKYVSNTVDYAKVGDHYYSDKAPGAGFLGIPVYAALKGLLNLPIMHPLMAKLESNEALARTLREDGTGLLEDKVRFALAQVVLAFVTAALPSAILGVLLYRLASEVAQSDMAGAMVALAYGLLTPAFAYANAFVGHQLSAVLLFGSFAVLAHGKNRTAQKGALVGALLGYTVLTEYPTAIGVLCLCLYGLLTRPSVRFALAAAGLAALCGLALGVYNNHIFGSPFSLGYAHSTLWTKQHETGFFSLVSPTWDALWGVTFSPYRGLYLLSPWLLLALPGAVEWWRSGLRRPELWTISSIVVTFVLFNASSAMWWGGWAVGPRYLLPALPFLALLVAPAIWPKRAWGMIVLVLALLWSLAANWGLSLAGQAFPPDTIRNPLIQYALPQLVKGNIARNMGMLLGLSGWWSILPLLGTLTLLVLIWLVVGPDRRLRRHHAEDAKLMGTAIGAEVLR